MSHATPARSGAAVAFVLKGYPRLSETFIAQEIHGLEQRGLDIRIVSLRAPREALRHPIHADIRAPVTYLPEYLHHAPGRVLRAWWRVRRLASYGAAWRAFRADLRADRHKRARVRRFGQALVLAAELPADVGRLHAHFLHAPASVTAYAARLRGLPWSCSAHAKDIWTTPAWETRRKLARLDWLVTCTASGRDHLAARAPDAARVRLAYHGLDLTRFPAPPTTRPPRDGSDPADPIRLLSVGRPVPKKGYATLLEALARLPGQLHWRFEHIGDGEELGRLQARAAELGLAERITWRGAQPQAEVLAAYRAADLFVLASQVAADGDRDGLPNVLMEAQSQALPCLATEVSAIPELIRDGETGRLVPPRDPAALAAALAELIADPARRQALGDAGAARVRQDFAAGPNLDALAARFGVGPRAPARSVAAE
jgi:glycosyltransferase involved in cell wall biosynthesis